MKKKDVCLNIHHTAKKWNDTIMSNMTRKDFNGLIIIIIPVVVFFAFISHVNLFNDTTSDSYYDELYRHLDGSTSPKTCSSSNWFVDIKWRLEMTNEQF